MLISILLVAFGSGLRSQQITKDIE